MTGWFPIQSHRFRTLAAAASAVVLSALACIGPVGAQTGGPPTEVWVVLNGSREIAVIDAASGSPSPLPISLLDVDGDLLTDPPPWGLAFSTAPGDVFTHAFVTQGHRLTVIDVASHTPLHTFDIASSIGATSLELRGCASSITREYQGPLVPAEKAYLHCAGTAESRTAVFVVIDQQIAIGSPTLDPVVDHGTLLTPDGTGLGVVTLDSPHGALFDRVWYVATNNATASPEIVAGLVASAQTLGASTLAPDWSLTETKTFPVTSLPDVLTPSAPIGGELPALPLGSLGRLENLDTGGGCDIGGQPVAMSIIGPGLYGWTVISLDRSSNQARFVNPLTCTTEDVTVGLGPVDVATLGWARWTKAWVANHDSDDVTQILGDGTSPTTIPLGPPPGPVCLKCPVSIGVVPQAFKVCSVTMKNGFPKYDNANKEIDLEWSASPAPCTVAVWCSCKANDPNDCPDDCNFCDCDLPPDQRPPGCTCGGLMLDPGESASILGEQLNLVGPGNGGPGGWIPLGLTADDFFDHPIGDPTPAELQYVVLPDDGN